MRIFFIGLGSMEHFQKVEKSGEYSKAGLNILSVTLAFGISTGTSLRVNSPRVVQFYRLAGRVCHVDFTEARRELFLGV
ncbi:hypothetical protein R50072_32400 [Simiduia litorea]